jgi:hypothetical protein
VSAPHPIFIGLTLLLGGCASESPAKYDRALSHTARLITGARRVKSYDPRQLGRLDAQRREIELKMFDLINEAALRRDKRIQSALDYYSASLGGYLPSLAVRHYRYVFGDKSQLDWLLAEDARQGFGNDSLTLIVFGYMDEWDRTIRRFKQHQKVSDGAAGELLHDAMRIRKQIYGVDRFETAWKRVQ